MENKYEVLKEGIDNLTTEYGRQVIAFHEAVDNKIYEILEKTLGREIQRGDKDYLILAINELHDMGLDIDVRVEHHGIDDPNYLDFCSDFNRATLRMSAVVKLAPWIKPVKKGCDSCRWSIEENPHYDTCLYCIYNSCNPTFTDNYTPVREKN